MSPGDISLIRLASGMDLVAILAVNLRRARHAQGLTQEELADRAGLSARHVGDIERARHAATVRMLGQLASALRVDPCELIARSPATRASRGMSGQAKTVVSRGKRRAE